MIPTNLTETKREFYRIAKRHNISMSKSTEKEIEVLEEDKRKIKLFRDDIRSISENTRVIDLIYTGQYTDTKGNDIRGSKALYLVDEDYYRQLVGEEADKQLSLF